jgi:WhiB family transcriptional regulator, redox-sensing transcriptional regulator
MRARRGPLLSAALGAEYKKAPMADDIGWQRQGLCRSDPAKWTPDPIPGLSVEEQSKEAIKICHQCPVEEQCKEWALEKREMFGVWGGLSEGEREAIWKKRRRARNRREHASVMAFYAV